MKVTIYQPSKTAMQSGKGKSKSWVLEYDKKSARTPESLMGWISSEDTMNQVLLKFDSAEDAASFATEKGWDYDLLPAQTKRVKPRNFSDNFKYIPPEEE